MINKIVGPSTQPAQKIELIKPESNANFMGVLRQQFEESTAELHGIPGMPGVYSPNPPQTLASLNITDISDSVNISPLG